MQHDISKKRTHMYIHDKHITHILTANTKFTQSQLIKSRITP